MMKGLMGFYFVIMIVCMFEHNYPKALYWFAAGTITLSILWGMR